MTATVTPMHVADLVGVSAAIARHDAPMTDAPLSVPVLTYLVDDGSGSLVVFDLGCGKADIHVPGRPEITNQRSVADAVRSLGRSPNEVTKVVVSHLHWDHCVGIADFPEASLVVQEAELDFALVPPAEQIQQYDAAMTGRRAAWLADLDRLEVIDGRLVISDELEIVPTPGHTAGSQSLLVHTIDRAYLLCGDLFMSYDQWTRDPARRVPPGLQSSLDDWQRSMNTVDELDCIPLPAHEPRALEVLAGNWSPR